MKKTVAISLVLAVLSSRASTIESDNAAGALRLESDMNYTTLPVPFRGFGGGARKVGNLVDAASLEKGDTMVLLDGETYRAVKYDGAEWKGFYTAVEGETELSLGDPGADAPEHGRGFWLNRTNNLARAVYMTGEAPSSYAATTVSEARMLLANPKGVAFRFFDDGRIAGAAEGDAIVVQKKDGEEARYTFMDGAWMRAEYQHVSITLPLAGGGSKTINSTKLVYTPVTEAAFAVPAGRGFWYVRSDMEGDAPVVNW